MTKLFKVYSSTESSKNVQQVLESGYTGQGPKVEEFESKLQTLLNLNHPPITTNSCTSALDLAYHLIGLKSGDTVISTPVTCFASNSPLIHRGVHIKWADVDPLTYNICPESVKGLMDETVKAIVAVNWSGRICDYAELKSFGVPVIEDAAHNWVEKDSFLNVERGDFTCYSFQSIKFLSTGDGGLLVSYDKDLSDEARKLRWYGLDRTLGESFRCTQDIKRPGFKYHMNDVAAAIGLGNLEGSCENVSKQIENYKMIFQIKYSNVYINSIPPESPWFISASVEDVDKFMTYMRLRNIETSPVHFRNDNYTCTKPFKYHSLPNVDLFQKKQVAIPCGWWLSHLEIIHIIQSLYSF